MAVRPKRPAVEKLSALRNFRGLKMAMGEIKPQDKKQNVDHFISHVQINNTYKISGRTLSKHGKLYYNINLIKI